jgi:hypothetical protein
VVDKVGQFIKAFRAEIQIKGPIIRIKLSKRFWNTVLNEVSRDGPSDKNRMLLGVPVDVDQLQTMDWIFKHKERAS